MSPTASLALSPRPSLTFGAVPSATQLRRHLSPNLGQAIELRFNNALTPFFRLTLEDFLAGVMLIDVFALWMPRATNALTRGAVDYNPKKDPKAQEKTGWRKELYIAGERLKRLNLPNFIEECGREIASGPGFFVFPTLVFALARRGSSFKRALHLSQNNIQNLAHHYHNTRASMPRETNANKIFQEFAQSLIDKGALLQSVPHATRKQDAHALNKSINHFTDAIAQATTQRSRETKKTLHEARTALKDTILDINRSVFARTNNHLVPLPKSMSLNFGSGIKVGDWIQTLEQWHPVHQRIQKQLGSQSGKVNLAQHIAQTTQRLLVEKAVYVTATMVSTLAFLYQLVRWTQGHDTYVANRTMPLHGQKHHTTMTNVMNHLPHMSLHPHHGATPLTANTVPYTAFAKPTPTSGPFMTQQQVTNSWRHAFHNAATVNNTPMTKPTPSPWGPGNQHVTAAPLYTTTEGARA